MKWIVLMVALGMLGSGSGLAEADVVSTGENHEQCCPTCPETVPWSCRYQGAVNRTPVRDDSKPVTNKEATVAE